MLLNELDTWISAKPRRSISRAVSSVSRRRPGWAIRLRAGSGAGMVSLLFCRWYKSAPRRNAAMKTSTDRILTTHVGSLPRPADLLTLLEAKETGAAYDPAAFEARVAQGVSDIVAKQVEAGIDSVSDGEQSKM